MGLAGLSPSAFSEGVRKLGGEGGRMRGRRGGVGGGGGLYKKCSLPRTAQASNLGRGWNFTCWPWSELKVFTLGKPHRGRDSRTPAKGSLISPIPFCT